MKSTIASIMDAEQAKDAGEIKSANPLNKYSHYNVKQLRDLIVHGHVRQMKFQYALNIPMDIATVIMKFYPTFEWSQKLIHPDLEIKGDIIENTSVSNAPWKHAYDRGEFDSGTIEFTVKILNEKEAGYLNHWTIGIVNSSMVEGDEYFPDRNGYHTGGDGFGYNSSGDFYCGVDYYSYGPKYGVGDIITTIVDFDKLSISFVRNGEDLAEVKEKLKAKTKYTFVVTSYCSGDTLTFLESRVD